MNRFEHGELEIAFTRIEQEAIVQRVLDTCRPLAEQNNVALGNWGTGAIGERARLP